MRVRAPRARVALSIAWLSAAAMATSAVGCQLSERSKTWGDGDRDDGGPSDSGSEHDALPTVRDAWTQPDVPDAEGPVPPSIEAGSREPPDASVADASDADSAVLLPNPGDMDHASAVVKVRPSGETEALRFEVAAATHAFVVSANARDPSMSIDLASLVGPGGVAYPAAPGQPDAERFLPTWPYGVSDLPYSVMVPNRPEQAYPPGSYSVSFRVWRWTGDFVERASAGSVLDVDVVFKRSATEPSSGRIDLLFLVVSNSLFDAAAAPTDLSLQDVLDHAGRLLGLAGITIGNVTYRDVDKALYGFDSSAIETATLAAVLKDHADEALEAVRVFLIEDMEEVGFSAAEPGAPGRPGLARASPIAIDIARFDGWGHDSMGMVLAHELGHILGLDHTTEKDWETHDRLLDTPECTIDQASQRSDAGVPFVIAADCDGYGLENVMFWAGYQPVPFELYNFSPDQAWVMRRHPIVY